MVQQNITDIKETNFTSHLTDKHKQKKKNIIRLNGTYRKQQNTWLSLTINPQFPSHAWIDEIILYSVTTNSIPNFDQGAKFLFMISHISGAIN